MSADNLFGEEACNSCCYLVRNRKGFRPLSKIVDKYDRILVSLVRYWKLNDVDPDAIKRSPYWDEC
jgi:hypothetical protein